MVKYGGDSIKQWKSRRLGGESEREVLDGNGDESSDGAGGWPAFQPATSNGRDESQGLATAFSLKWEKSDGYKKGGGY